MKTILSDKYYKEESVFLPENLLREARRQKHPKNCNVPSVCLLDPDGDLVSYLVRENIARKNICWACYHSVLYTFRLGNQDVGIVPCIVGSSYAVLVAEQLFVSGCELLISITSAGIISQPNTERRFALITSSVRDEGTSYHYLAPGQPARISQHMLRLFQPLENRSDCPYFNGTSWTTDAPFRGTASAISAMKKEHITCVEMEAAALYALSEVKNYNILCFAHITNSMARNEGDFEKGEEFGSIDTVNLVNYILKILQSANII